MTVLERLKELGRVRAAACLAYKAKPSKFLHDTWQEATTNLDLAVEEAITPLFALAEACLKERDAIRSYNQALVDNDYESAEDYDEVRKGAIEDQDAALAALTKEAPDAG